MFVSKSFRGALSTLETRLRLQTSTLFGFLQKVEVQANSVN